MNKENIEAIIRKASVCRLGMLDGDTPYIVPLCFGYRDDTLYFHGSIKSRKYKLIQKHPKVCFEFDILAEPMSAEDPCDWDMRYQSVVGFGKRLPWLKRPRKNGRPWRLSSPSMQRDPIRLPSRS